MAAANRKRVSLIAAPIGVTGWDSDMLIADTGTPAVVINPAASPAQLMSWAYGNLQQLDLLLMIISTEQDNPGDYEPAEIAGAVRHFTEQAMTVLKVAINALNRGGAHG